MASGKKLSIWERYTAFSETDIKAVKTLSYGIASISLAVALYRIRPFAKFRKPSSLPSRFLRQKVQLHGTVVGVEPGSDTLLMVDHKPLIPLPRLSSPKYLPIKIAGIDVTSNGINWLQTIVKGKEITFIPLAKEKDCVTCIILMQQNQECIKIAEALTKVGFALVRNDPLKITMKDKDVLTYQKRLSSAQKWAERKRNGYWQFVKRPTLLWKAQESLSKKLKSVLPNFITQQLNI
ncbi:uncharacterized protein LOC108622827 [Ceratina calcarata]|uniref:Uncharacterized protein LOC108622827 n=1 Tax=Ceratina calcarata TaxID=156304 RepID=A0AAJ7ITB4_9HYME|nr:uncharacterized protein LOC108622827 [Ceratina calcarata]XP_017876411.1 uncharacterized protein LOC108622827 [Ceratina calcarata]XP_017876412.1 uncharacterized protein LOC108622827 [Ceratina calcarata]XP_017876413.1 uncharacterized protein LOC108622827 [Ceratina calcarata]XP_017876414.1 uncharacterized protein LOC108622827 [Ceratina calcarata]XP_026667557.1 uncharacterized protein LOC108622827 [Ceratina calcarata]